MSEEKYVLSRESFKSVVKANSDFAAKNRRLSLENEILRMQRNQEVWTRFVDPTASCSHIDFLELDLKERMEQAK